MIEAYLGVQHQLHLYARVNFPIDDDMQCANLLTHVESIINPNFLMLRPINYHAPMYFIHFDLTW